MQQVTWQAYCDTSAEIDSNFVCASTKDMNSFPITAEFLISKFQKVCDEIKESHQLNKDMDAEVSGCVTLMKKLS